MNIFAIEQKSNGSIDWEKSAQSLDNLRVVKMILESCQLLSTALHKNGIEGARYKPTHLNHPSTIWTAESSANFENLILHTKAMLVEYSSRFNKIHACQSVLEMNIIPLYEKNKHKFPSNVETPLKVAMPKEFQTNNIVESYQNYYVTKEKMRYPKDKVPKWFSEKRDIYYTVV
jgi:hypothetical protein